MLRYNNLLTCKDDVNIVPYYRQCIIIAEEQEIEMGVEN